MNFIAMSVFVFFLYLFLDYHKLRIVKFRRLTSKTWEIAFSEAELFARLDGAVAEVYMPEKPLLIRLYRKVKPMNFIETKVVTREDETLSRAVAAELKDEKEDENVVNGAEDYKNKVEGAAHVNS